MRHVLRLSFALLRVLCATLSVAQPSRNPLTLLRSTPSGDDVPLSSQLAYEFSRPVMPLGRIERAARGNPVELAVAVLDESVFDLIASGHNYFDPYKEFYRLAALDLHNFNLLKQLTGRQKFDKKRGTLGSDGGLDLDLRPLFKFVSYWNPALIPDAEGRATLTFELSANLTGWRVLAMAVTPDDRMGLGEGHFKANKPTETRPALPNQVTAGDSFEVTLRVLNRTEAPRTRAVTLNANGSPPQESTGMRPVLTAAPYKRYLMRLRVQTTGEGEVRPRVHAGDGQDQDALAVPVFVLHPSNQALRVAATDDSTTAHEVRQTVVFPPDIRTDVGQVSVVATPTVIGGLEGVFTYRRDYLYACWEQKLTTGVMAAHYQSLGASLPAARNFVVVGDPVSGGLEPMNRDLATASKTNADKAAVPYAAGSWWCRHNDWRAFGATRWSLYHRELRHHAVRLYSEYLPAGRYHLAYVAQAIAPGEFAVQPLRAEEMYNPETYGLSTPATLRVRHADQHEARQ